MVDSVYQLKGGELWPDVYDYRADGSARLQTDIAAHPAGAAAAWSALGEIVGKRGFPKLFQSWQQLDVDGADPIAALRTPELAQFWERFAVALTDHLPHSPFAAVSIAPANLNGSVTRLALDDGTAEARRSIGQTAYGRLFAATASDQFLTSVSLFGARYGNGSGLVFDIVLCDSDYRIISSWSKPYAVFDSGDLKWVSVDVPPTRVPAKFYVLLNFHATASDGVYAGVDQGTKGNSVVGSPGKVLKPFSNGDWMIRVELKQ